MKKFLLSLLVLLVSTAMMANKSVTMNLAGKGVAQKDAATQITSILNCQRSTFAVVNEREDQAGITHISLQQTLGGSAINGAMIFVHCKGGVAVSLNGQYVADAELPQPVQSISKAKARKMAKAPKKAGMNMVVVEANDGQMRWAYETVSLRKQQKVWIDAETGEVLRTVSLVKTAADVTGTAETLNLGIVAMTSSLTDEGDYALFDEGRRIYTYDATHWDPRPVYEILYKPDEEADEDGNEEEPAEEEIAGLVREAFGSLVSSSKEYRSASADWSQKEIRKVTIVGIDGEWMAGKNNSCKYAAAIKDAGGNLKEGTGVFDFAKATIDAMQAGEEFDGKIVLVFENVCHIEPADVVEIYSVSTYADGAPLSSELLGTFSIADALAADDFTLSDEHMTCSMDIYNGPWLDAHAGMQAVYDYYKNVHGRDSYDGQGAAIHQFVNVPHDSVAFGSYPLNAAAMGFAVQLEKKMPGYGQYGFDIMAFGAGDGRRMNSVAGFDILAHEFTHLVSCHNGNGSLEYQGESGAIEEAFADIMGCAAGHYSGLDTNWTIGETVMKPCDDVFRNMAEPKAGSKSYGPQPDTYGGEYWISPNSADDLGGVHTNSGVMNHWFYLLSEGGSGTNDLGYAYDLQPLGIDKAATVALNTLLYALTPTAKFQDACDATTLTARNLYGESAAIAVAEAWKAVGVTVADGLVTGIEEVKDNCQLSARPEGTLARDSQLIYNLAGQRVGADYRGIVVKNGRKAIR